MNIKRLYGFLSSDSCTAHFFNAGVTFEPFEIRILFFARHMLAFAPSAPA
jgi:hypothetical protein